MWKLAGAVPAGRLWGAGVADIPIDWTAVQRGADAVGRVRVADVAHEPGSVNWVVAQLMPFIVNNQGHLPVTLVIGGTSPWDITSTVRQVVGPDQDHPTIELWGQT